MSHMEGFFNHRREYGVRHAELRSCVCYLGCPHFSSINMHHTVIRQSQKNIQPRCTSLHINHVWGRRETQLEQIRSALLRTNER